MHVTIGYLLTIAHQSENLHDAFNELDWSNTRMSWLIADTQPYFRLATDGPNGSCQVDYPKDSEVFMVYESTTAIEFQCVAHHNLQKCWRLFHFTNTSLPQIQAQTASTEREGFDSRRKDTDQDQHSWFTLYATHD
jgi:hypothetical protein